MSSIRNTKSIKAIKSSSGALERYRITVRRAKGASLGRIILCGEWSIYPDRARGLLRDIGNALFAERRGQARLHVLTACGGFIEFEWPEGTTKGRIGFDALVVEAEATCKMILTSAVRESLSRTARFLSFGMDAWWGDDHREPHVELVVLVDLDRHRYYWTGKSYPMPEQRRALVTAPLISHAVEVGGESVFLLGCHDLTAFNPRAISTAKGERLRLGADMRALARAHQPTLVLQHPHVTDTARSWRLPWLNLVEELPSVERWMGAGRYVGRGPNGAHRGELNKVLRDTASEQTIDVLVV